MKKAAIILTTLLTLISINAQAVRLSNGDLAKPGDPVEKLFNDWGKPDYRVKSQKTCGKIISLKKTVCSTSRYIWKRGSEYWRIQYSGRMIIKIKWTRSERKIRDSF